MAMTVEIRSPRSGEWIAVNPSPDARLEAMLIRDNGEVYMVAENMIEQLRDIAPDQMMPNMLFTAQNRDGEIFLWPVPSPVAADHLAYRAMDN